MGEIQKRGTLVNQVISLSDVEDTRVPVAPRSDVLVMEKVRVMYHTRYYSDVP